MLIKNARIADGTGNPWFLGDIGISREYIVAMDRHVDESAHLTINADGRVASPGFIDIHSHDGLSFPENPDNLAKLSQGVTTVVVGNCGFSMYPIVPETKSLSTAYLASLSKYVTEGDVAPSISHYSTLLEAKGLTTNVASLVGHGAIRIAAMGYDLGPPSRERMSKMKWFLGEAMEGGAFGLSIGLIYAPGSFADTAELRELAKTVGEYGGFLAAHIRTYGTCLLESIQELLQILRKAKVPGQVSHLEAVGLIGIEPLFS
jgi:N-acyl-D-aspartate/D-glutamate deacylase